MFDKNDKALLTTRKIAVVVLWIFVVGVLVAAIVMAAVINPIFLLIWPAGWFVCWLLWVAIRLRLCYHCDIKLIRNKLYNIDNDNLKVFLEAKLTPAQRQAQMLAAEESNRNAERLKTLYDSGVITEEEYARRMAASPAAGAAPRSAQTAAGGIDEEKLARLKQLLDSGVLTEEEYLEEITKSIK